MAILEPQQVAYFAEQFRSASALEKIGTKLQVSESGLQTPMIEGEITAAKQETVDGVKQVSAITVSSEDYTPDTFYTLVEVPKRKFDGGGPDLFKWIVDKSSEQIALELDRAAVALLEGAADSVDYDENAFGASVKAAMKAAGKTDGFLFDSIVEPDAIDAVTGGFVTEDKASVARLYGRDAVFASEIAVGDTVGYAGQFKDNLIWGIVDNYVDVLVSRDGTANGRSALDRNLVFVRVEVLAFVALVDNGKIVKFATL